MTHGTSAYGLWALVAVNSAVFIIFTFSFFRPSTKTDWRSFGAFSAFVIALFVEMYGFPLTIYFLSGWLQSRFPNLDPLSHQNGHLWYAILGFKGDPHLNPIHVASNVLIVGGLVLLSSAWRVLYSAQKERRLATKGPYAHIRHPQYASFILIMFGFLVRWPTILTLAMFPFLTYMYVALAHREERAAVATFGEEYRRYANATPGFFPRMQRVAHGAK